MWFNQYGVSPYRTLPKILSVQRDISMGSVAFPWGFRGQKSLVSREIRTR